MNLFSLRSLKSNSYHWNLQKQFYAKDVLQATTIGSKSATLYTKNHEWLRYHKDTIYRMGISEYGQRALGDLVYAEIFHPNQSILKKDTVLGCVESVKGASDVYSPPIDCTLVSINPKVIEKPSLINKDAEGDEGWLCEVELCEDDAEKKLKKALLSPLQYHKHCTE